MTAHTLYLNGLTIAGGKLSGLSNPVSPSDAVSKGYLDLQLTPISQMASNKKGAHDIVEENDIISLKNSLQALYNYIFVKPAEGETVNPPPAIPSFGVNTKLLSTFSLGSVSTTAISKVVGDAEFKIIGPNPASSNGSDTITASATPSGVVTLSAGVANGLGFLEFTVTVVSAGNAMIRYVQAESDDFQSATLMGPMINVSAPAPE